MVIWKGPNWKGMKEKDSLKARKTGGAGDDWGHKA
jgi:hypothetical protein